MHPVSISILLNFLSWQRFLTVRLLVALLTWSFSNIASGLQEATRVDSQVLADVSIRVVDEAHVPIADVDVFPSDSKFVEVRGVRQVRTNAEGRVTLSGVPCTNGICKVGAITVGYAIQESEIRILPEDKTSEHKIVLKRGKTITGSVFHKDGAAPDNSIYAVPVWCPPSISPMTQRGIKRDGTFELENIIEGEYRVFVPVPAGEAIYRPLLVLDSAKLSELTEPLELKVDYPSRSSMKYIRGKIRWISQALDREFVIKARASDRSGLYSDFEFEFRVKPNTKTFVFGPLPAGKYDISVNHPRIENLHLRGIEGLRDLNGIDAPTIEPLTIRLRALPQPQIAGIVVDAESGKPIEDFYIQYYVDPQWTQWFELHREDRNFLLHLPNHGKCSMSVWAEGFAVSSLEPFDTLQFAEHKFEVKLQRGAQLNGVITDDSGKPVDGAEVQALSFSRGVAPKEFDAFALREGTRKTINGQFKFESLPIGVETLRISHPDFETKTVTTEIRGEKATVEANLARKKETDCDGCDSFHDSILGR